jgi:CheY-like chemotaxis protein
MAEQTTTILAVDDEPSVLAFLRRCLQGQDALTLVAATDGASALRLIDEGLRPIVVIADRQMPGIDGVALLGIIREKVPDAIRILLTGAANLDAAIAAVNVGHIFRFLTKPCPHDLVLGAVTAAIEQHRLITAERVLLEETLQGTIKTLVEVLSLTNSVSFGRAMRIRKHATALADRLQVQPRWPLEVAAMLSQIGCVTLPADVAERVYHERPLTRDETLVVGRLPAVTEQLLGNIPRLETVRAILALYMRPRRAAYGTPPDEEPPGSVRWNISRAAQLLRAASDFDTLEARGNTAAVAIGVMRGRSDRYAPDILDALAALQTTEERVREIQELKIKDVRAGMVLAEDLMTAAGALLVVRGYEMTENFIERCRNYPAGWLREPIRVMVPV